MIRDDFLLRVIDQLAAAIARIAGLREKRDDAAARAALDDAWESLGVPRDLVMAADDATLATLIRDPRLRELAVELRRQTRSFV